jgi:hypothetical protein
VLLPREADGSSLGDDVLPGRASPPTAPARRSAPSGPASLAAPRTSAGQAPERLLARSLAEARGRADAEGLAAAAREIGELVAEGQAPERIAAAIESVRRRSAREAGGDT